VPFDFGALLEYVKSVLAGGAVAAGGLKTLKLLFRTPPAKDLPPCHTRIQHKGAGWPWNKNVAIHCSKKGQIHIKLVEP
jgi:hypothetical protein